MINEFITCPKFSRDYTLFKDIFKPDDFPKSVLRIDDNKLYLDMHESEIELLVSKLKRKHDWLCDQWVYDIEAAMQNKGE